MKRKRISTFGLFFWINCVWLLIFAAGLSFYFGEWVDGITILTVEPMRKVLTLYSMSTNDWLISIGASVVSLIIIQIGKKLKIALQ